MSGMENILGAGGSRLPGMGKLSAHREFAGSTAMAEKIQNKVAARLEAAGVSDETRDALVADLTAAIQQQLAAVASGEAGGAPALRQSVQGIMEKYGLDTSTLSMGGRQSWGYASDRGGAHETGWSQSEAFQRLVDALGSGDDGVSAATTQFSDMILHHMSGMDRKA